jgi:hypothetical protein
MKNHRKLIFLFLAALMVAATVANVTLRGQGQKPTSIDGKLTEKQTEHSKLYKEYKGGKKLSELVAEIGDVKLRRHPPLSGGDLGGAAADPHEFLRGLTCEADAIVVGKVKDKASQVSESGDFIFTDYEMTVARIFKDNAVDQIQPDKNITITRPGGRIRMNGRTVEALDDAFEPFTLEGHYLVFLRFIPVTGAYKSIGSKSSFELRGNAIHKLTREASSLDAEFENKDAESFLKEIGIALTSGCPKGLAQ